MTAALRQELRDPVLRLCSLFDVGTMRLLTTRDRAGVVTARGLVHDRPAIAYATETKHMAATGCARIVDVIRTAVCERMPVLALWHARGGVWDGMGRVCAAMVRASGLVPQISVLLGPAAEPMLTDVIVKGPGGRVDNDDVVHTASRTDAEALRDARLLTALLGHRGHRTAVPPSLPQQPNRETVREFFDGASIELVVDSAPDALMALGRFGGHPVGVLANGDAERAGRFVWMCNAFGVPLVTPRPRRAGSP